MVPRFRLQLVLSSQWLKFFEISPKAPITMGIAITLLQLQILFNSLSGPNICPLFFLFLNKRALLIYNITISTLFKLSLLLLLLLLLLL